MKAALKAAPMVCCSSAARVGGMFSRLLDFFEKRSFLARLTSTIVLILSYRKTTNLSITAIETEYWLGQVRVDVSDIPCCLLPISKIGNGITTSNGMEQWQGFRFFLPYLRCDCVSRKVPYICHRKSKCHCLEGYQLLIWQARQHLRR